MEKRYCPYCLAELNGDKEVCHDCLGKKYQALPSSILPGTVLHERFLIGKELDQGSMTVTYIGRDLTDGRKVVIKEFFPLLYAYRSTSESMTFYSSLQNYEANFERDKNQFLKEAHIMEALSADNSLLVHYYCVFEENGTAYAVMEYLDGITLADRVKENGKLLFADLLPKLFPLMQDIGELHKMEVLHLGIEPHNIMLMPDGSLKLFELRSKLEYDYPDLPVMLNHGFAPVEMYNIAADKKGPWTDVFGLCATVYYCITATRPIDATERILKDALVFPSKLGASIEPEHEEVLMQGLEVIPQKRIQTMEILADSFRTGIFPRPPAPEFKQSTVKNGLIPAIKRRFKNWK